MKTGVVDADPETRDVITATLEDRGHAVRAFRDAEGALAAVQQEHMPLLILDWLMPGMGGREFCGRLRALPQGRDTLLVVLGEVGGESLAAALAAGADDYLARPVDRRLLDLRISIAEGSLTLRRARQDDEERRHVAEARYRTLVEHLPIVTYVSALEPAGTLLDISPQIEQLVGVTATDWLAAPRRWIRHMHPDDRQHVLGALAHTVATGAPFRAEYRLLTDAGQVRWVRDEAVVVQGAQVLEATCRGSCWTSPPTSRWRRPCGRARRSIGSS